MGSSPGRDPRSWLAASSKSGSILQSVISSVGGVPEAASSHSTAGPKTPHRFRPWRTPALEAEASSPEELEPPLGGQREVRPDQGLRTPAVHDHFHPLRGGAAGQGGDP